MVVNYYGIYYYKRSKSLIMVRLGLIYYRSNVDFVPKVDIIRGPVRFRDETEVTFNDLKMSLNSFLVS